MLPDNDGVLDPWLPIGRGGGRRGGVDPSGFRSASLSTAGEAIERDEPIKWTKSEVKVHERTGTALATQTQRWPWTR